MKQALSLAIILALPASGDVLRILDDPRDAAQVRVDVMQQAQKRISAIYFLARHDQVTLTSLALLRDAQRRGVTSRLVVDAHFHRIPKAVLAHLRDEGVPVKVYHPLTLRHPSWIIRRMHEKLILADESRYITGGRNLAEAYFELEKKNYIDRDIYVEGTSAIDATRHFDELWNSPAVVELRVRVSEAEKQRAAAELDAVLDHLKGGNGFVDLDTGRDWSAGIDDAGPIAFLHDPLAGQEGERVGVQLAQLFERATKSIVIESPYLIPPRPILELLERKSAQGVRIRIVTNSLRSTDGVLPYAAYLKYRGRLIRAGIELREFKGPDVLHAKSIVIDERIAIVGSYNLDPRSHYLNAESMCVSDNRSVAGALLASIGRHEEQSWKIDAHGRVPNAMQSTTRTRALGLRVAKLLLPFLEGQL